MDDAWTQFVAEIRGLDTWQQVLVVILPFVWLLLTVLGCVLATRVVDRVDPILTRWWSLMWVTAWRVFFPMSPVKFGACLDRACRPEGVKRGPVIGQAAVMLVQDHKRVAAEMVPFDTPVVATYQGGAFHFLCRLPCPDPKGFPVDGGEGEYAWSVSEAGGKHVLTLIRSCPDHIGVRVRGWLVETVNKARKFVASMEEFVKALEV